MDIPDPQAGLVIRYSFLWSDQARQGVLEGSKDRPCAIILVVQGQDGEADRVSVLPVTHSPPAAEPNVTHLRLTEAECRAAGLDGRPHWVVLTELNRFTWPGYDLRAVPGTGSCVHGRLPAQSYRRIVAAFLALDEALKGGPAAVRQAIERDM